MGSSHGGHNQPHEPYQRRRILSKIDIAIEKGIKCLTEYVECPRGNIIYTKCFIPDSSIIAKPKGLICQTIGYTGYVDYDLTITAQDYCKKGYAFFTWDHYGHGRSSGLWIDIDQMQWLIDDAIFICNYAHKKYPLMNNYLFGTSMGGNIVSRIIIQIQQNSKDKSFISTEKWNGIILFSPMVAVDPKHLYNPFVTYLLEKWVAYYFPKAVLLPKSVGSDISKFSRDPKMAQFISKNPLSFPFGPRPKTAVELLTSAQIVQDNSSIIGTTDIPLLVFHGDADDTTKSSMSLKMVKDVSQRQLKKDATHKILDGAYHGLMVDSCRYDVLDMSIEWMDKHNKQ